MNEGNMSRPVADDVIAVLEEIRYGFRPSDSEPEVPELRKKAVLAVAQTEFNANRFINLVSAQHSIQDACVRRLGYAEVTEFDAQVANWLEGRAHDLDAHVLAKATTDNQRQRLAEVLRTPTLPLTSPQAQDLESPPAGRVVSTVSRIIRDTQFSNLVKRIHNYECQICGHTLSLVDGLRYAEGHHVKPLGVPHNGPDLLSNIICLCPNHHAACDLGAIQLDQKDLRTAVGHAVDERFLDYHNSMIYRRSKLASQGAVAVRADEAGLSGGSAGGAFPSS